MKIPSNIGKKYIPKLGKHHHVDDSVIKYKERRSIKVCVICKIFFVVKHPIKEWQHYDVYDTSTCSRECSVKYSAIKIAKRGIRQQRKIEATTKKRVKIRNKNAERKWKVKNIKLRKERKRLREERQKKAQLDWKKRFDKAQLDWKKQRNLQ